MGRRTGVIVGGITACVVAAFLVIVLSPLFYDRSNPRNRPNSYLTEVSVEVNKTYLFVKYRKPDIYKELSGMHNQFRIINADGLIKGAVVECIEGDEEDIIHHRYVVKEDKEDTLIHYASTPSTIYDKETKKRIGTCNTYVYYDFIRVNGGRTLLRQTVVIDMLNPFYKAVGDVVGWVSGGKEAWSRQFQEELQTLKEHIEK